MMNLNRILKRIIPSLNPLFSATGIDVGNDDESSSSSEDSEEEFADGPLHQKRRLGYKKAPVGVYNPATGRIERVNPMETTWYKWYVEKNEIAIRSLPKKSRIQFRRRFVLFFARSYLC